ncbi:MAG: hypothetical protein R3F46_14180 [bacterium]
MDDKKKQLNQIIILVVLLGGLGVSMGVMIKNMNKSKRPAQTTQTTAAATPQGATTKVTPMGTIVTGGSVDTSKFTEQGLVGPLNNNMFRIYDINARRNPFSRESGWFSEELEKIPGREISQEYLNEMTDEVPDLNNLFKTDKEFVSYRMEKVMAEEGFSYEGVSEDGRITTSIQALTKTEPTIRVDYSEAQGTEVERVAQTDAAEDGQGLPIGGTPFGNPGSLQGPAPRDIRAPRNGEDDRGAMISCSGVSIKGDSRSALLQMPDGTHLVREGDVLMPGNFKVVKISELGVEIRDIRTAEQVLIPLSNPV